MPDFVVSYKNTKGEARRFSFEAKDLAEAETQAREQLVPAGVDFKVEPQIIHRPQQEGVE